MISLNGDDRVLSLPFVRGGQGGVESPVHRARGFTILAIVSTSPTPLLTKEGNGKGHLSLLVGRGS